MPLRIIMVRATKESVIALADSFALGIRMYRCAKETWTALTNLASLFVIMDGRSK